MKIGIHFDENGDFVGDFLEGMTLPEGHTLIPEEQLPETLYVGPSKRPKLVDGVIDQTEAQAEVEALAAAPRPPSDIDILGQQLVAKELQILDLQQQNHTLSSSLASLEHRLSALEGGGGA